MDDDELLRMFGPTNWVSGPPPDHIYIATAGDFVKIGASRDVERRLEMLAQEYPTTRRPDQIRGIRPALVASYECRDAMAIERALHDAFAEYRDVGEWFRIEGRMATWLKRRQEFRDSRTWSSRLSEQAAPAPTETIDPMTVVF